MAGSIARGRVSVWFPLTLIVAGCGVLAWPGGAEGDVLIPISEGHGLTAIDLVGAIPLVAGIIWSEWILWRFRRLLAREIANRPGRGAAILFLTGLGLGLLLAAVVPSFWWWAVGAALAGACFLATVLWLERNLGT